MSISDYLNSPAPAVHVAKTDHRRPPKTTLPPQSIHAEKRNFATEPPELTENTRPVFSGPTQPNDFLAKSRARTAGIPRPFRDNIAVISRKFGAPPRLRKRPTGALMKIALSAALLTTLIGGAALASAATPTFNKEVLPILQTNCQGCHRPGEVAPMSFMTYDSTRPWAKAIKTAILAKKMPPWFADERYGHWANAPKMTAKDVETLTAWADNGAPEGSAKDRPAPVSFPEGWQIKPDLVVQMPEAFPIPAKGVLELPSIIIQGFDKDTWVTSIEVRPSNPAVVHHLVMSLRPHNPKLSYGAQPTRPKERDAEGAAIQRVTREEDSKRVGDGSFTGLETVWVPGTPALDFRQYNAAKLIPAGYDIVLGMHYTPNGTATSDQTKVGFTVLTEPPARRFVPVNRTVHRRR